MMTSHINKEPAQTIFDLFGQQIEFNVILSLLC